MHRDCDLCHSHKSQLATGLILFSLLFPVKVAAPPISKSNHWNINGIWRTATTQEVINVEHDVFDFTLIGVAKSYDNEDVHVSFYASDERSISLQFKTPLGTFIHHYHFADSDTMIETIEDIDQGIILRRVN